MSSAIKALWQRLEAALAKHSPEALAALAAPAKAAQLAKLEAEFGKALPEALKASWAIHDGQEFDDGGDGVFADFPFYSVAAVRGELKELRALAKSLGEQASADDFTAWHALVADGVGFIDGPVKAHQFHSLWLPIGSVNGDVFRFLDFDPAPGGVVGQMIEVDPEGVSWRVLAPSFEQFLARFVDGLEAGEVSWDEPECGSGALFPRRERMPTYLEAYAPKKFERKEIDDAPAGLNALRPGQALSVSVEVSRIMGGAGQLDCRLDLADGEQVWATATASDTRGYKQITMRARGIAELQRLPGKKAQYAISAFSKRK